MTALDYIRRHLESDYPVHAEMVLEKLNQRLLEEIPETESTNEFDGSLLKVISQLLTEYVKH